MAKLQTKIPVLYDARDCKIATVIVEMKVIENGNDFTVEINDFAENEGVTTHIKTKSFFKSAAEINGLYEMVSPMVDQSLPYSEREKQTKEFALLVFVQNDFVKDGEGKSMVGKTIYNLTPNDWEIKREIIEVPEEISFSKPTEKAVKK